MVKWYQSTANRTQAFSSRCRSGLGVSFAPPVHFTRSACPPGTHCVYYCCKDTGLFPHVDCCWPVARSPFCFLTNPFKVPNHPTIKTGHLGCLTVLIVIWSNGIWMPSTSSAELGILLGQWSPNFSGLLLMGWLVSQFQHGKSCSFCQYFSLMVYVGESCHHLSSHANHSLVCCGKWKRICRMNFAMVCSLVMKWVIGSPSFCRIILKFCWSTSSWNLLTTTSLMCCNNCSTVAESSVLAPSRSNRSLFSSEVHAALSSFRITARFNCRHISFYQPHVSMNRAQSPLKESNSIVGLSGFHI